MRKMLHDLNLSPHILDIDCSSQLLLRDWFAGEEICSWFVCAEVGDTELASSELATQIVTGPDIAAGRIFQDPEPVSGTTSMVNGVVDGEGVLLLLFLLPLRGPRSRTAISHGLELQDPRSFPFFYIDWRGSRAEWCIPKRGIRKIQFFFFGSRICRSKWIRFSSTAF